MLQETIYLHSRHPTHPPTWCLLTDSVSCCMRVGPTVGLMKTRGGFHVLLSARSLWMLMNSSSPRSMREGEWKSNRRLQKRNLKTVT